jgi:hypothetical protein
MSNTSVIRNKTADDAAARLSLARAGSLANKPSAVYLAALLRQISEWSDSIREDLYNHPDFGDTEKG